MRRKGWLWISWCDLLEPEKTPEPAQPWTMHEAALAVESMTTAHLREVEVAEEHLGRRRVLLMIITEGDVDHVDREIEVQMPG